MNRKDTLRALLGSSTSAPEKEEAPASDIRPVPEQPQSRVGAGAVRAMGLSLQKLTAEADRGRVLQAQLEGGSNVVEIDPDCIDPSFISDRLSPADDDLFRELVESIATHGQQVPILVRPHPNQPGRYQIAYGHRRVRAASTLKKKVRAIIRALTNAELVIAQGKENLERRDLSFIERALFAKALEDEGFEPATVIAALTVHKAEMTRFIAVARSIPFNIIQAIGPAPRPGALVGCCSLAGSKKNTLRGCWNGYSWIQVSVLRIATRALFGCLRRLRSLQRRRTNSPPGATLAVNQS